MLVGMFIFSHRNPMQYLVGYTGGEDKESVIRQRSCGG